MDNKVWYYPFCFVEVFFLSRCDPAENELACCIPYQQGVPRKDCLQNELEGELSVVIYYYVSDEKQKKTPEIDV